MPDQGNDAYPYGTPPWATHGYSTGLQQRMMDFGDMPESGTLTTLTFYGHTIETGRTFYAALYDPGAGWDAWTGTGANNDTRCNPCGVVLQETGGESPGAQTDYELIWSGLSWSMTSGQPVLIAVREAGGGSPESQFHYGDSGTDALYFGYQDWHSGSSAFDDNASYENGGYQPMWAYFTYTAGGGGGGGSMLLPRQRAIGNILPGAALQLRKKGIEPVTFESVQKEKRRSRIYVPKNWHQLGGMKHGDIRRNCITS